MSQPLALSFRIDANTAAAIQQVGAFTRQLQAAAGLKAIPDPTRDVQAGVALSVSGLVGLIAKLGSVSAAALSVKSAIKKGFEINAETESATLGIKALIAGLYDVRDANGKLADGPKALAIATGLAEDQVQKLRIAGLETAATFEQLLGAYQQALGPGAAAMLGLDQIREFTVGVVQAAGAIGVPMHQLGEEVRSILAGDITVNSRVAQALQITSAQIKSWKEQNVLAEKLTEKLKIFRIAGSEINQTWTATMSNMADAFQLFLGKMTGPAFQGVKKALQDGMKGVFDVKAGGASEQFKGLQDAGTAAFSAIGAVMTDVIGGAVALASDLSGWFTRHHDTLEQTSQIVAIIYGDFKDLLGSIAGVVGGTGSWVGSLFDVNKALQGVGYLVAEVQDTLTGFKIIFAEIGASILDGMGKPLKTVMNSVADFLATVPGIGEGLAAGVRTVAASIPTDGKALADYARMLRSDIALNGTALQQTHQKYKTMEKDAQAAREAAAELAREVNRGKQTGSVTSKPQPPDPKALKAAQKAAEQYAQALLAYNNDKAAADKEDAKTLHDKGVRDLEAAFKARLKTQEDYLTERAVLDAKEVAQDLAAAKDKEAALLARTTKGDKSYEIDPAKRKKYEGDLLKVQADIRALEEKGASIPAELKLKLKEFNDTVDSLSVEIKAELLDQQGLPFDAQLLRLKKKTEDLLKDPRVNSAAGQALGLPDAVKKADTSTQDAIELARAKALVDDKAAYVSLAEQRIAREVQSGKLTEIEGEKAVREEREKTRAGLLDYIATLERLAAAYPDNKEFALSLAKAKDEVAQLDTQTNTLGLSLAHTFADTATNALGEFLKGTQSVGDAVKGLFRSLFQDIANEALKLFNQQLFKSLASGSNGGGSMWGSIIQGVAGLLGYADGGHIQGPGTGTSDSILARLSNGEFVLKAAAVRKWGVGFLNSLNSGYMPRAMPAFASGGFVSSAPAAAPQVGVTNNISPTLVLPQNEMENAFYSSSRFEREVIRVRMANGTKYK